jgi:hypothetical protein
MIHALLPRSPETETGTGRRQAAAPLGRSIATAAARRPVTGVPARLSMPIASRPRRQRCGPPSPLLYPAPSLSFSTAWRLQ